MSETNGKKESELLDHEAEINSVAELKSSVLSQNDFSWNEVEDYSDDERERLSKLYEGTLSVVNEKQIVNGTIVSIGEKEVVLNIGFKSEGVVPVSEFRDLPEMKVGDSVEVYLDTVEDKKGQLVLSRKRANAVRTWKKINIALTEDSIIEGIIRRRTKGGFVVDIEGVEAFLPGSQIDVKPVRDFDSYLGRKMEFKVVKINHPHENVVISHKVLIEKDLESQKGEILKNLEKGQVLEGTVKNMTNFGVFVDLGGLDGLLHITDISWGRINHPEEVLKLDQKINVVVLDFDDEKKRISLGLKQLEQHPWDKLTEDLQVGNKIKGKVVTVTDYGIFVEILPGVEGLVHLSEMSWSQHLKNPTELYKSGEEVEATILSIDRDERKMSLGIKQGIEDPWTHAGTKYALNTRHTGIVRNMTNYGLFVELEEGVDGLVHVSDLSWTKKIKHPSEFIKKDEKIEVLVLEIDVENRRLSLGHKQLTEDPWDTFQTIFSEGSVHQGNITKMTDKGAILELEYGIEGFVPTKHLAVDKGKPTLKGGDAAEFKVIEFHRESKKIVLSHTKAWKDAQEEAGQLEKPAKKASAAKAKSQVAEKATLGDIDALSQLKANLLASEQETAKKKLAKGLTKITPANAEAETSTEESTIDAPVAEVSTETEAPELTASTEETPVADAAPAKKAKKAPAKAKEKAEDPAADLFASEPTPEAPVATTEEAAKPETEETPEAQAPEAESPESEN
jgi:small subunit ribosomal protein S1